MRLAKDFTRVPLIHQNREDAYPTGQRPPEDGLEDFEPLLPEDTKPPKHRRVLRNVPEVIP